MAPTSATIVLEGKAGRVDYVPVNGIVQPVYTEYETDPQLTMQERYRGPKYFVPSLQTSVAATLDRKQPRLLLIIFYLLIAAVVAYLGAKALGWM